MHTVTDLARPSALRIQFAAAASIFLVNGIMIGAWVARIAVGGVRTAEA